MGFLRVVKNKAYFKRYQVKFRRRREGKTDFQARRRLTIQDKNKYNTPKYRFVVRFTNRDVICQIIYAKIVGDFVMTAAYSHELPRYGLKVGLTNYSAAYATGLLLARRHLKKLKLDDKYEGNTNVDGSDYNVEENDDGPRPFCALLDVGLVRTTTGARVFAAMKGACDGGLNVPHSDNRFAGYDSETQSLSAETLRKYIFGGHVGDYMTALEEQDADKFKRQFSRYIAQGINAGNIEKLYTDVHAAIRKDPTAQNKPKSDKPQERHASRLKKLTLRQRRGGIKQRKHTIRQARAKQ